MSFGQAGSTWVAQRRRGIEAVMVSFYYHKVDPDFLRNSVYLFGFVNAIHYILFGAINNPYLCRSTNQMQTLFLGPSNDGI
jgi:hypothetical protein|tara:strand:+ start:819 stop:1061 length:243 start_codon:yes stop_codon:yes gene_type:complete